jgi:hypothetical protein
MCIAALFFITTPHFPKFPFPGDQNTPVYWMPLARRKLELNQSVTKFVGFNDHGKCDCDGKVLAGAAWGGSMITL